MDPRLAGCRRRQLASGGKFGGTCRPLFIQLEALAKPEDDLGGTIQASTAALFVAVVIHGFEATYMFPLLYAFRISSAKRKLKVSHSEAPKPNL